MFDAAYRVVGLVLAVLMGTTLIEVPSWGSVSLIEALWTLSGVVMIVVSAWALPVVVEDYVITKRVPGYYSDARALIARGHVRREVIRLAQGGIVTVVGLFAIFTDPARPGPTLITPLGIVLTAGLIALALLTAFQSVLDRRQRDHAEALIGEARERGEHSE